MMGPVHDRPIHEDEITPEPKDQGSRDSTRTIFSKEIDSGDCTPSARGNVSSQETDHIVIRNNTAREDGKVELTENDAYEHLGFSYPSWRKWQILIIIFLVQLSMNLNTSLYPNAVPGISDRFNVSPQATRVGQATFLIAYGFGSELWAPWSEQLGRRPILQASLILVNVWSILCAVAPNFGTIVVGRILGGLSSAGGSVTLGMVADLYEPDEQGFPLAFIVLSSVGGSAFGPIFGSLIQTHANWRWLFWVQLIVGVAAQMLHFVLVPETRTTIVLDQVAEKRRKAGETMLYGPTEIHSKRIPFKEVLRIWGRPFKMFFTEPIVLFLSLLSGFSDALIFTFLDSFTPVFAQWNFSIIETGLAFIA